MNEFIVWYENEKLNTIFSREFILDELIEQKHLDEICNSPLLKDYKVKEINRCVGKTDINNKKIYADCSIVEFAFKGFGEVFAESYMGYFVWNDFRLRYDIKIINKSDKDGDSYIFDYGKCLPNIINNEFKIIDTIQENKLGLFSKKQA